jgi:hypothetical protein
MHSGERCTHAGVCCRLDPVKHEHRLPRKAGKSSASIPVLEATTERHDGFVARACQVQSSMTFVLTSGVCCGGSEA